jgi:hypothetical protein
VAATVRTRCNCDCWRSKVGSVRVNVERCSIKGFAARSILGHAETYASNPGRVQNLEGRPFQHLRQSRRSACQFGRDLHPEGSFDARNRMAATQQNGQWMGDR